MTVKWTYSKSYYFHTRTYWLSQMNVVHVRLFFTMDLMKCVWAMATDLPAWFDLACGQFCMIIPQNVISLWEFQQRDFYEIWRNSHLLRQSKKQKCPVMTTQKHNARGQQCKKKETRKRSTVRNLVHTFTWEVSFSLYLTPVIIPFSSISLIAVPSM